MIVYQKKKKNFCSKLGNEYLVGSLQSQFAEFRRQILEKKVKLYIVEIVIDF